jgi:hypothetical protein
MSWFRERKWKEFWGLIAAALVFYLFSLVLKWEDAENLAVVTSAALFIIAIYRLKKSS